MIFLNPGRNIIYYRPKCGQVGFSGPSSSKSAAIRGNQWAQKGNQWAQKGNQWASIFCLAGQQISSTRIKRLVSKLWASKPSLRDHQYSLRDHLYGCRGGNHFEKGGFENLTNKYSLAERPLIS